MDAAAIIQVDAIIVSRHPAAVDFCREAAADWGFYVAETFDSVTAADVEGRVVFGNLPFHLAALAVQVYALEFEGTPPRGTEYGFAEMQAAGARLVPYTVTPAVAPPLVLPPPVSAGMSWEEVEMNEMRFYEREHRLVEAKEAALEDARRASRRIARGFHD